MDKDKRKLTEKELECKKPFCKNMELKTVSSEFSAGFKQKLLESFRDESFHYMQGNAYWEKLKSGVYSS